MIVLNSTKTIELDPSFYAFTKAGKIKKGDGLKLDSMKWDGQVCIEKLCSICKVTKLGEEFDKEKYSKDGRASQCKKCIKKYYQRLEQKEYQKEYRQKPEVKENRKQYDKQYHQKPEVKKRIKEYNQRPEQKEKLKQYQQRPEVKEKQRQYQQKPETKEKQKQYRQIPEVKERGRARVWISNQHKKNKSLGLLFDKNKLTTQFYLDLQHTVKFCPICKVKLDYTGASHAPNLPSIDCLYPKKGYTIENINLICLKCNTIKHNITDPDRFIQLANWMKKKQKESSPNNTKSPCKK